MNEDTFHLGIKAIIRNTAGQILLFKVSPNRLKGFKGEPYWDIPGGRVEKGESVETTLKREIFEEAGIKNIVSWQPFNMVLANIRIPQSNGETVGLILSAYLCQVNDLDHIQISDEHTEFNWFSPAEAAKLLTVKYPPEFTSKLSTL